MNDGDGTLAAKAQGRQFGPLGTALVIIPTYNEAENIKSIVGRVREAVPEAHVLIADDNSPDGTGKLADETGRRGLTTSRCCTARARRASAPPTSRASAGVWSATTAC